MVPQISGRIETYGLYIALTFEQIRELRDTLKNFSKPDRFDYELNLTHKGHSTGGGSSVRMRRGKVYSYFLSAPSVHEFLSFYKTKDLRFLFPQGVHFYCMAQYLTFLRGTNPAIATERFGINSERFKRFFVLPSEHARNIIRIDADLAPAFEEYLDVPEWIEKRSYTTFRGRKQVEYICKKDIKSSIFLEEDPPLLFSDNPHANLLIPRAVAKEGHNPFDNRLAYLRFRKNLTLSSLSFRTGIPLERLEALERKQAPLKDSEARRLAPYLRCEPYELWA